MGPGNWCQGMNSASLCSLAGWYENPIPPRCLVPIDFLKIPALSFILLRLSYTTFQIPTEQRVSERSIVYVVFVVIKIKGWQNYLEKLLWLYREQCTPSIPFQRIPPLPHNQCCGSASRIRMQIRLTTVTRIRIWILIFIWCECGSGS
jgi:hypothetical protein